MGDVVFVRHHSTKDLGHFSYFQRPLLSKFRINRIGEFSIVVNDETIQAMGTLRYDGSDLILECNISSDIARILMQIDDFQVYGKVLGTELTLLQCRIINLTSVWNTETIYVSIKPSEIIIGRCYSKDIEITKITSSMSALNYMFPSSSLSPSKDNPFEIVNTSSPEITATDDDGRISLYQSVSTKWSKNEVLYSIIPVLEITFHSPLSIKAAIAKVATLRNLLSFFADYYLPLENITFSDEKSRKACDCTLLMNYVEKIDTPIRPFLVPTDQYADQFNERFAIIQGLDL